jgi:hypothetical protein
MWATGVDQKRCTAHVFSFGFFSLLFVPTLRFIHGAEEAETAMAEARRRRGRATRCIMLMMIKTRRETRHFSDFFTLASS